MLFRIVAVGSVNCKHRDDISAEAPHPPRCGNGGADR